MFTKCQIQNQKQRENKSSLKEQKAFKRFRISQRYQRDVRSLGKTATHSQSISRQHTKQRRRTLEAWSMTAWSYDDYSLDYKYFVIAWPHNN
jgi:uncharacterized protein involved in propanediol utilization